MDPEPPLLPPAPRVEWTVSWATLLKLMAAVVLAEVLLKLWALLIPLCLALLVAVTLTPLLHWLRKRLPHWVGLLICVFIIVGSVALLIGVLVPTVSSQGTVLISKLPTFKTSLLQRLPAHGGWRESAEQFLSSNSFTDPAPLLKSFLAWAGMALEGVENLFIIIVFAIYFLIDGPRTYEWLLAFLPPLHRRKVDQAAPELVSVVGHYVVGQLIISTLCAIFVFTVLSILKVPGAGLLAVLAGVFDVLPIIGITLSMLLAMAIALTVSPAASLTAGVLYGGYHLLESYFIVPRIYGNRLRLSGLVVLLSCIAAVLVLGFVGAVLVLPLVASYPIIERIWLRPYLERDTVNRHVELDHEEG